MVASGVGRGVLGTISCPLPQILREDYYFHLQLILLVRVYNIFKHSLYFHFRIDRKDLVIRSGEFPSEVVTETCPSPPVMSTIRSFFQILLICDASLKPGQGDIDRNDSQMGNLPRINTIIGTESNYWTSFLKKKKLCESIKPQQQHLGFFFKWKWRFIIYEIA